MHPSRLRLGPSQSRPLTDASPGSARSPGLRVCRAAPSHRRNIHTHAPFRTECQSFLRCRDMSLTISRKQRSGHAAALAGCRLSSSDLPRSLQAAGSMRWAAAPRQGGTERRRRSTFRCDACRARRSPKLAIPGCTMRQALERDRDARRWLPRARREVDRFRSVAVTSGSAQGRGRSGPHETARHGRAPGQTAVSRGGRTARGPGPCTKDEGRKKRVASRRRRASACRRGSHRVGSRRWPA